jgi:hypothetical protein
VTTPRPVPTPQAIAGAIYDLLGGSVSVAGFFWLGSLQLEEPLDPFVPGTVLTMGVLYLLAGVVLFLPWRVAFHVGRVFLVLGIAANLALAFGAGVYLPRDLILDYPLLIAAPGFLVGLAMLEAIVLFWPEDPGGTQP